MLVRLLENLGPGWARLLTVTGVLDPRDRRRCTGFGR